MEMVAEKRFDPPAARVAEKQRETWPDIYRGIAIIAVVLIHATGHAKSQISQGAWSWFAVAAVNRALQFAVPAFLLACAYLIGSSLAKESGRPGALMWRRLKSIGLPYLLASMAGAVVDMHAGRSISIMHFVKELILCRASFHLYFIALIVQLYLV